MPHLSPMSWLLALIMFYLTLSLFISTMWWHQQPKFPNLSISKSSLTRNLNWS